MKTGVAHFQAGFGLIEVLVSAALMAGVVLISATATGNQHKNLKQNEQVMERNDIVANLKSFTQSEYALNKTFQWYSEHDQAHPFFKCIDGNNSANDCVAGPSQGYSFIVFNQAGQAVAGDSSHPVFYKDNGAPCTGQNCAFKAEAFFKPYFQNGVGFGPRASSIKVDYLLTPLEGRGLAQIKTFRTEDQAGFIDVNKIVHPEIGGNCSPGQVVLGIGTNGAPICSAVFGQCEPGTVVTGFQTNDNQPICTLQAACPTDKIMAGFDTSTTNPGRLVCVDPVTATCAPGQVLRGFDVHGNAACVTKSELGTCSDGQFLQGFDPVSGSKVCVNDRYPKSTTCGVGKVVAGFDGSGVPVCMTVAGNCGANQKVVGLTVGGGPICVADSPTSISCPDGQVLKGFSAAGAVCVRPPGAEIRTGLFTQVGSPGDHQTVTFSNPFPASCGNVSVTLQRAYSQWENSQNDEEDYIQSVSSTGFTYRGDAYDHAGKQYFYVAVCQ